MDGQCSIKTDLSWQRRLLLYSRMFTFLCSSRLHIGFATDLTTVVLNSLVSLHVNVHLSWVHEILGTQSAKVVFNSPMFSFMTIACWIYSETLFTSLATFKMFLPCMNSNMSFEIIFCFKSSLTLVTWINDSFVVV